MQTLWKEILARDVNLIYMYSVPTNMVCPLVMEHGCFFGFVNLSVTVLLEYFEYYPVPQLPSEQWNSVYQQSCM